MSDNNGWPDPARPGVPINPDRDGWHWVQRVDKGFVPIPRVILWTDDWTSRQFSWDAIGYEADERKLGRDFRYIGPCLTPAEVDARVAKAQRDALKEAAQRLEELHRQHKYDPKTGEGSEHDAGYYRALSEGAAWILALGEEE